MAGMACMSGMVDMAGMACMADMAGMSDMACMSGSHGFVSFSRKSKYLKASSADAPHISRDGCRPTQNFGLSGFPNSLHLLSPVNCMHRMPEGLPSGIPGTGDVIEGAMQHAPHPCLQFI